MNPTAVLDAVHGPWVYLVLGLSAFAESAAFIGLVLPGETLMVLAGVLAAAGRLDLAGAAACAIAGAVLGDQAGYALGRVLGPRLRTGRIGGLIGPERWSRAEAMVGRRGGAAVFLGRWVGLLRAVVPAAAGATGMRRATFTLWNLVGGISWAGTVLGVGYLAGGSWSAAAHRFGTGTALGAAAGAVVLIAVAVLARRRRGAVSHRPYTNVRPQCSTVPTSTHREIQSWPT